jgi:hypothetical protein
MAHKYLKCKYHENIPIRTFFSEYLITFRIKSMDKVNPSVLIGENKDEFPARNEEWCIIRKNQFTPICKTDGLVNLEYLTMRELDGTARVGIRNLDGVTYFTVPMEDIVVE